MGGLPSEATLAVEGGFGFPGPHAFFFFLLSLFIYFERETSGRRGTERKGDGGSEVGSVPTAENLMWHLNS